MPAIVLEGNPIDGLTAYGPFSSYEEANEWADNNLCGLEWWATQTHTPFEEEER